MAIETLAQAYRRATQRIIGAPWLRWKQERHVVPRLLGVRRPHPEVARLPLCVDLVRAASVEVEVALQSESALLVLDLSRADLMGWRWRDALAAVAQRFADVALDGKRPLQRTLARSCRAEQADARQAAFWATLRRRAGLWSVDRVADMVVAIRVAVISCVPEK